MATLFALTAGLFVSTAAAAERSRIVAQYGSLPLNFEENKGQTDRQVKFLSRGSGYALFLTPQEAVISLSRTGKDNTVSGSVVRMQFSGARDAVNLKGEEPGSGVSNYFSGSDPSKWITGSRHYGRVVYDDLYPGVDAVFYGNQKQLEYDLVVAPGADPSQVRMRFSGAERIYIDASGALVLSSSIGDLRQKPPVIYQNVNGRRKLIKGRYVLEGDEVTFEVARYDRRKPLVIDPVLVYSTFLGGTGLEEGNGIAVDGAFNAYVVGRTDSAQFPFVSGPFTVLRGTADAFLVKINPAGNGVVFANYLGGSGADFATGVAVDADQNVYVTGGTDSLTQFPLNNAHQPSGGGAFDAFLVKYTPQGNFITFGTYLGGFQDDVARGVTVDSTGAAYVVGTTASTNFNANGGAQPNYRGTIGTTEGFITKFSPTGQRVYGSYISGSRQETANAVAVDADGAAYVTGQSTSLDFVTTANVIQPQIRTVNAPDAYVVKFSPAGNAFAYATFLGGSAYDEGFGIAVDAEKNAYVAGDTDSGDFGVVSPFQPAYGGARDGFIVKLNPGATARVYSSFIGGSGADAAHGVKLDSAGVASVVGTTQSPNFPVNNFVYGTLNRGSGTVLNDAFLVRVNAPGSARLSSTFLGGGANEFGSGIAVDTNGNAYLVGSTQSSDFPVLSALQASFAGTQDAFVSKITNCEIVISPSSVNVGTAAGSGSITISGPSDCPWTAASNHGFITLSGPTTGTGNGTVNYSFAGNPGQPRVGTIFIGGQTFTVNQQGGAIVGCVYPPTPASVIALAEGQSSTFILPTADPNCAWTATPNVNWIQVNPPSGTGQTTVGFTVFPNFSTLVRSGTITMGSQTLTITQAGTALNSNQRFVALVYFNFLGRYPGQSEIDFQVNQLNAGVSRADLIMSFYGTSEFNLGGRFVAGLYAGILARDPEFGGWLFQRNALARGGITQGQLLANFLNSQEFQLKYGGLDDAAFVQRMYLNILGRTPSQDEVNFQVSALPSIGRVGLATNFLNSTEFRSRIDARMTAFLLHATLLMRDGTPTELALRQSQIATGTPVRTLVDGFITSLEFTNQLI